MDPKVKAGIEAHIAAFKENQAIFESQKEAEKAKRRSNRTNLVACFNNVIDPAFRAVHHLLDEAGIRHGIEHEGLDRGNEFNPNSGSWLILHVNRLSDDQLADTSVLASITFPRLHAIPDIKSGEIVWRMNAAVPGLTTGRHEEVRIPLDQVTPEYVESRLEAFLRTVLSAA